MPVKNGDLDFTQKTTLMPSAGTVRVGTRTWSLATGFGGIDFTHGLFARLTAWRWGFALGRADDGTPIAFNLADGINGPGASENAVSIDRTLTPVATARFIFDAKHLDAPWQVQTDDGALISASHRRGCTAKSGTMWCCRATSRKSPATSPGPSRMPAGLQRSESAGRRGGSAGALVAPGLYLRDSGRDQRIDHVGVVAGRMRPSASTSMTQRTKAARPVPAPANGAHRRA